MRELQIEKGKRQHVGLRLVRSTGIVRTGGASARFAAICVFFLGLSGPGGSARAENAELMAMPRVLAIVPMPEAGRARGPDIFGTIALPVRPKPLSTRWAKLMFATLNQPSLVHLVEGAHGLPPRQQAAFVQSAVNQWVRPATTTEDCSDSGYWPSAQETLVRGSANCFGIAIAKMEALRMLGVPTEDLYLTSGRFRGGPSGEWVRESVALLVRVDGDYVLLPEQSDAIVEAGIVADPAAAFSPVLTYGVTRTWVHGRITTVASLGQ
jgi:hypothetical protein